MKNLCIGLLLTVMELTAAAQNAVVRSRRTVAAILLGCLALSACGTLGPCNCDGSEHIDGPDLLATESQRGLASGRLQGKASVGNDGTARYSVPLWVPEGRAGMKPELSLEYNSHGGNGQFGQGWMLTGVSRITRCAKTVAQDGVAAAVKLDASDRFCADGQRLVAVNGVYGAHGTEYRTETNNFTRYVSLDEDGYGPLSFRAYLKNGHIESYGGTPDSRLELPRTAITPVDGEAEHDVVIQTQSRLGWAISEVRDRSGNTIRYVYEPIQVPNVPWLPSAGNRLVEIRYTEHPDATAPPALRSARLTYEGRPDVRESWTAGVRTLINARVSRIDVLGPNPSAPGVLRSYGFTYVTSKSTGRSLLHELKECDGASICKAPTRFAWWESDPSFDEYDVGGEDLATGNSALGALMQLIRAVDLNGDGKDDLLYREFIPGGCCEADRGRWWVRLSTGTGFAARVPAGIPDDVLRGSQLEGHVVDLNRDGRVDLVKVHLVEGGGGPTYRRYTASASGVLQWDGLDRESGSFWSTGSGQFPSFYTADLDGDGLPEGIRTRINREGERPTPEWQHRPNVGGVLGEYVRSGMPALSQGKAFAVDIDGSGRIALLALDASPFFVDRMTAYTLSPSGAWERSPTNLLHLPANPPYYLFADFNGDGLKDAVELNDAGWPFRVYLNTGNGFLLQPEQANPGLFLRAGWLSSQLGYRDPGVRLADVDGDGNTEILLAEDNSGGRTGWTVLRWTSAGFVVSHLPVPVAPRTNDEAGMRLSHILDVNGDGLTDIVQLREGRLRLYVRRGVNADLMREVTDGYGARNRFDYGPLADRTVHSPDTGVALPQAAGVRGPWLVTYHHTTANPGVMRSMRYQYGGARFDISGRGWLGFSSRLTTDLPTGAQSTTWFDVETRVGTAYPYTGLPKYERYEVPLESGETHRFERWTEYALTTSDGGAIRFAWPRHVLTSRSERAPGQDWEDATVTQGSDTTNTYDADGNVTSAREVAMYGGAPTGDERILASEFDRWPDAWIIGRLRRHTLTSRAADGTSVTRTATYEHDPATGLRTAETVEPGDALLELRMAYERNRFGQLVTATAGDAAGAVHTSTVEYDATDGTFAEVEVNAAGHRHVTSHHPGLGVVAAMQDANGARSRWKYDGFGRLRRVALAGGASSAVEYGTASPPTLHRRYNDCSEENETYDLLGRLVKRKVRSFEGVWVTESSRYDALGRLAGVTPPHSAGLEPSREVVLTYDRLGRPIGRNYADGTSVSFYYSTSLAERIDARGNRSRVSFDGSGRVAETANQDALGTWTQTRLSYGPFDNVTQVQLFEGPRRLHDKRYSYDRRGRRTSIEEPYAQSTHLQKFEFDAFDNLQRLVNADGRVTSFERDGLGRPFRIKSPDGVTSYVWDTAVHGIGELASSTSPDGVTIENGYDALGRPTERVWNIGGLPYRLAHSYDARGRPYRLKYPAVGARSLELEHRYAPYGGLKSVQAVGEQSFWTAVSITGRGEVSRLRYGNAVSTHRSFDPVHGRLTRIDSIAAGSAIQALRYGHDPAGNVSERHDETAGIGESFEYDHLDRLAWWTVNAKGVRSVHRFRYDALGNMLAREVPVGLGTPIAFTFDTTGRANPYLLLNSSEGAYAYDARGNQMAAPGRRVDFTDFDLPRRVLRGDAETIFKYDAEQRRVVQRTSSGDETTYVGDLYVRAERAKGSVDHFFHVYAGGEPIAQVAWMERPGVPLKEETLFLHTDYLGSPEVVTDGTGAVVDRLRFDVFGGRADPANPVMPLPGVGGTRVWQGFTGHEHDDALGLINMRGREYDPRQARFLSRDLELQPAPARGQTYNPYSYAVNNPLRWVDPSGWETKVPRWSGVLNPPLSDTPTAGTSSVDGRSHSFDEVQVVVTIQRSKPAPSSDDSAAISQSDGNFTPLHSDATYGEVLARPDAYQIMKRELGVTPAGLQNPDTKNYMSMDDVNLTYLSLAAGMGTPAFSGMGTASTSYMLRTVKPGARTFPPAELSIAAKGVTNPAVAKLAAPAIPEAMTQAQFGTNLIGWGVGPQSAAARTWALTADAVGQMQAQGLTREMATQWRGFYANEFARNANNLTARNRVQLMDTILGLMK